MEQELEVESNAAGYAPSDKFLYAALFLLTWVFYGRCIGFEFTNWDDLDYLVRNPVLRRSGWDGFKALFVRGSIPAESLYVPVTYLSYWVEARLFGLTSQSAHAINVLIHGINALVVMAVCHQLLKDRLAAFIAATLF